MMTGPSLTPAAPAFPHTALGVKASTVIYEGSAVGIEAASRYARQFVAGDQFVGFAFGKADNTSGGNGAISVKVQSKGYVIAPLTVAVTDINKPLYMSDGDTFTLTQGSNSHVGVVYRFIDTSNCILALDAPSMLSLQGVAELTDSSGGTASDTLPASARRIRRLKCGIRLPHWRRR
jgi:hypothetical protein